MKDDIDIMLAKHEEQRANDFVDRIVEAYKEFVKEHPDIDAAERKADGNITYKQALDAVEEAAIMLSDYA